MSTSLSALCRAEQGDISQLSGPAAGPGGFGVGVGVGEAVGRVGEMQGRGTARYKALGVSQDWCLGQAEQGIHSHSPPHSGANPTQVSLALPILPGNFPGSGFGERKRGL